MAVRFTAVSCCRSARVLQHQFPMAAERQCQCAADHNEQFQHASIVAGVDAKIKRGRVLARVNDQGHVCRLPRPARVP